MSTHFRDRLSFCFSIAIGLVVSTGHPAGLVAATAMPLACLAPGTRRATFRFTLGYYVAALWPIFPGFARSFEQSNIPLAIWLCAAILLSMPWTIAWTSDRFHLVWRAPLAVLATVVPPLGIAGLAAPLTGAGYLFPGSSWAGTTIPGYQSNAVRAWAKLFRLRYFLAVNS